MINNAIIISIILLYTIESLTPMKKLFITSLLKKVSGSVGCTPGCLPFLSAKRKERCDLSLFGISNQQNV